MRDQSDPQFVGERYLALRAKGIDRDEAAHIAVSSSPNIDSAHQGPVEKYGCPDDVIVLRAAQAPVLGRRSVAVGEELVEPIMELIGELADKLVTKTSTE